MPHTCFRNVVIKAIAGVVPEVVINIDSELEFYHGDKRILEKNKKILGLGLRHVADERTVTTDLCEAAAASIISETEVEPKTIDTLIAVSSSHEYQLPATACLLQDRLKLDEDCCCYDISGLACSAYVTALYQAYALISSGASKRCLIVAGDIPSRQTDRRNRISNMLFGDAGTATLLEYTDEENPAWFITGTRGKGWDEIVIPAGGAGLPVRSDITSKEFMDSRGNVWHLWDEIMRGMDVFVFSTDIGPKGITAILSDAKLTIEDIDYIAIHQANAQIVKAIAKYARLPSSKWSTETFRQYGNCASAATCLDLIREMQERNLKKTLLASFGVGLSWGFALIDLGHAKSLGISTYRSTKDKLTREEKIENWVDFYKKSNITY